MRAYGNATPLLKPIFLTPDLTWPKRPPGQTVMGAYSHATPPLLKAIFLTTDLTWPKRPPHQNFMGANCNATPPLLKAIFFDYIFDLTKKYPPSQNFMGANCNATPPLLKAIFFDYRFDLTNFDPPSQNFMGAICHVTPLLNDILDLCRFDLTYLTPTPKFYGCISSRYITSQPFMQSASSRSRHNKNHVLPKRSTMLKSISCLVYKIDIKRELKEAEVQCLRCLGRTEISNTLSKSWGVIITISHLFGLRRVEINITALGTCLAKAIVNITDKN